MRLNAWHRDARDGGPGEPDASAAALSALGDIGVVRRLLDHAEFVAVRTARGHGRSWAEIATRLGVSRQSAWERWRDIDDDRGSTAPSSTQARTTPPVDPSGSAETLETALHEELVGWAARGLRRSSTVRVPAVVGLSWDAAREALVTAGLVAVAADPDAPPPQGRPEAVVTDQSPEGGAKVPPGARVTLWVDRGGGSGVREPRRPKPDPTAAREVRQVESEEAVG